jgi:hypothetical protein
MSSNEPAPPKGHLVRGGSLASEGIMGLFCGVLYGIVNPVVGMYATCSFLLVFFD